MDALRRSTTHCDGASRGPAGRPWTADLWNRMARYRQDVRCRARPAIFGPGDHAQDWSRRSLVPWHVAAAADPVSVWRLVVRHSCGARRAVMVPGRSRVHRDGTASPGARLFRSTGNRFRDHLVRRVSLDAARDGVVHAMILRRSDIVCISSIDWDFIWQGHQEIMSTLAAEGHRVLFVENTGVRAPNMRDLPRVRQRIRNWWRGTKGFREERPNLFVYSPLLVPLPYSRVARSVNRLLLVRALRRWMRAIGFHRPIVWTFLPTPIALDLIDALDPELTIYYCIDDLAASSPGAKRIISSEQRLFAQADLVFVTSERLRERAARASDGVHVFPFGVNFDQ